MAASSSFSGERKRNAELVAIVGMGCRLPGGTNSPSQMWSFLRDQRSGFRSFDSMPRCFSAAGFHHPHPDRPGTTATNGAFLVDSDPRLFDHAFFNITGRETETLDPSQRKLLEVVYEAFENAGETWASVAGSNTGVFVGNFALDHWLSQARDWDYPKPYSTTGASPSILANRISHVFDLRGPSVTVDTACSSSMYAVHLAVSAIRSGDCDSAIVAASNWIADPSLQIALNKLGALSPTSACHTFDASADGYARGEGFAALYLRRLPQAITGGSPIRAVIRGTAVNANGRTGGIARPNAAGQEAVIRKAYDNAGLPFSDTTYLECHGTGTPAGDPIELAAVGKVFASDRSSGAGSPGPLLVGSVKTNMGHAEGASALAAIMKVVLSLEAGEIPPSIGVNLLNPNIDFAKAGVEVVRQLTAWPQHRLLRASVNSFGFGGANGHCIIDHVSVLSQDCPSPIIQLASCSEISRHVVDGQAIDGAKNHNRDEATNSEKRIHHPVTTAPSMTGRTDAKARQFVLLPFSAHNDSSLQLNIHALSQYLDQYPLPNIAHIAYTISAKRSDLSYKTFRVVDRENPQPGLLSVDGKPGFHKRSTPQQHQQIANVAFVFTGQGAQWHGMCKQLFEYRVFRTAIEHMDHVLRCLPTPPSTWSVTDVLKGNCDSNLVHTPAVSQTSCTAIQIGLVDLLASWSIRPAAVLGHSSGEIAAAYAAGRTTAADAIIAAYLRGLAVEDSEQNGAMLAVALGLDQLQDLGYLHEEDPRNGRVQIAAINSPGSVTVSGDRLAVEALAARLDGDGVFHRLLRTGGIAYHSHHMLAIGQEYEEKLAHGFQDIRRAGLVDERELYPRVMWVSSVTPDKDPPSSIAGSAAYWRANLESPVRFSRAISNLAQMNKDPASASDSIKVLIEIGPHSALKGPLEQILKSVDHPQMIYAGSTLTRGEDARKSVLQLCGALYCLNARLNLVTVNAVDNEDNPVYGTESHDRCAVVHGKISVDLPPYQYTYGPINYYECRSSKEYRLRKDPRHDLLGSKVPGTAKLRPQWRNVLRIKDLPWLGEHSVLPDVIFPAAGYIAMAIEAAQRTHEGSPQPYVKPTGYAFRNMSIKQALVLNGDDCGVEVMLSMDLIDNAPTASSPWANFSISSVGRAQVDSIDSMWTEHCTGAINVEVGALPCKVEKINTASMEASVLDTQSWYKAFETIGLGYGPSFQAVSNIRADPDKKLASATIALNTTAGMMPGGESRYALHPTAIDATFQLGIISCYGGRVEAATTAFVPVHFSRLYINGNTSNGGRGTAVAVALGEFRGLRGAHVNKLQMLGPEGEVLLDVENLRCVSYTGKAQLNPQTGRSGEQAFSAHFARLVWKPDFRCLDYSSCQALFPPPEKNVNRLISIGKLTKLACAILVDVYEKYLKDDAETTPIAALAGDVGHFVSWIKRCAEDTSGVNPGIAEFRHLSPQERHEAIGKLYSEIEEIIEARIAKRLHENMGDILSQSRTGLDVVVNGNDQINLLPALYQHGLFMVSAYPQLSRVLDGLAHANPHLRILEIGAGTGGATRVAMEALTGPNSIKRYREYVFTDISPGFLTAAQESMAEFRDISYSVLDIEADPAEQGYQPVYDIVLASQALHATAEISQTLRNCRKLLRPQGKLVLVENTTENSVVAGLILGTWTGFWHETPDGRVNGPFVGLDTWDRVLREVGFSGAELVLDDYPRPNNVITTLVSTLEDSHDTHQQKATTKDLTSPEVHLLHSADSIPLLLEGLHRELGQRGISPRSAPLDQALSAVSPGSHVVVLSDGEEDCLLDTEACHLATFQHLACNTATLVCLTFSGFSRGRNPAGALIPGLLRTIGTENPAGRFISIDVFVEDREFAMDYSQGLVQCVVDQLFPLQEPEDDEDSRVPQINDHEYVWQDNCLWVSRVVPDGTSQSLQSLDSRGPIRAAFSKPGLLSSLHFRPYTELLAPLPSDYIDVKVAAVGINWKDLAVSSGRFDADNLSSEYSGVVTAVGTKAYGLFRVGDRVYGMGPGHFGNYTRVPAAFAQKLDEQDDLVEVATMPLVYMTAVYAFDHIARLRRGQTVLIQSATGGLGLAAIQLAQAKGVEVYAMVGTAEKAAFLTQEVNLPASRVIIVTAGDSTSFLDRKLTRMTPHSRGFDVVLATARGEVLRSSVLALAPLGHLVDVGRTDVQDSKALGMEVFRKSASFSSFDLSIVLEADTAVGRELMQTVHNYYRAKLIGPVRPISVIDVSKLGQALLKFSKGTHFGKLVVTFQDPQTLVRMPQMLSESRVQFDTTAYYIVVGGLGGLGRSIVKWMCERGAHNLVILSRSGLAKNCAAAQDLVETLTRRGIIIQTLTCDISSSSQVMGVVQAITSASPGLPIRGIIHAAVSYLDISFNKITASRWRDSLAAKVQGTKNLHEATLPLPPGQLDFFVMITSIETICALATQSAYTAANAFQDAFARYRRRLNMPAISLSFGFVKGVGELGQRSLTGGMFARNRVLTLSEGEFLTRLEQAFLRASDGNVSSSINDGHGDGWIGQPEDPLSASNILTCLDPSAMAAKEREDEVQERNAYLARPSRSTMPRWYGDARVSLVMRALQDARRDQRPDSFSAHEGHVAETGKMSVQRIRRRFGTATTAEIPERSKTVDFVTSAITNAVAELLFVDASNVNPALAVAEHGVDSLIASELRNWFHQALGAEINMQELLDAKRSIAALAGVIVDAALVKRQSERRVE